MLESATMDPAQILTEATRAQSAGDLETALRLVTALRTALPDRFDIMQRCTGLLRDMRRDAELADLLAEAHSLFPNEESPLIDQARLAESKRDWETALRHWRAMLDRFPGSWLSHTGTAAALRERRLFADADAILFNARLLFPGNEAVLVDFARVAEAQADWPEALRRWETVRETLPDYWLSYAGPAAVLRNLGRYDEADAMLSEAQLRFPDAPPVFIDHCHIAGARRDWAEALRRWRIASERFPNIWFTFGGMANALHEMSRFEEAEAVLLDATTRFPNEQGLVADLARLAERRRDWPESLTRWSLVQERFPYLWFGYTGTATALRELGRHDDADECLLKAQSKFPGEPAVFVDYARIAEVKGDWPEAARRYAGVRERFPHVLHSYLGEIHALLRQNAPDAAEAVALAAKEQFPNEPATWIEYARTAGSRRDLPASVARWQSATERFPNERAVHLGLAVALREADRHEDAMAALDRLPDRFRVDGEPDKQWASAAISAGKVDAAVNRLESAVERHPNDIGLKLHLLRILVEAGRIDQARPVFQALLVGGCQEAFLVPMYFRLAGMSHDLDWSGAIWPHVWQIILTQGNDSLHWECARTASEFKAVPEADFLLEWMLDETSLNGRSTANDLLNIMLTMSTAYELRFVWQRFVILFMQQGYKGDASVTKAFRLMTLSEDDPKDYVDYVWDAVLKGDSSTFPLSLRIALGFEMRTPARRDALKRFLLDEIVGQPERLRDLKAVNLYLLMQVADALGYEVIEQVIDAMQRAGIAQGLADDIATMDGVTRNILTRFRPEIEGATLAAPPLVHGSRRLKICLCVSGQLRGYKVAAPTIATLGFQDVDLVTVVHTWKHIGRNLPQHHYSTRRTFKGRFVEAYENALSSLGWQTIRLNYPRLIGMVTASGEADARDIGEAFNTDHVVIEDEAEPAFRDSSIPWKMYNKISKAHRLGRQVAPDADLFIRSRPDRDYSTGRAVDWHRLRADSEAWRRVFVDKWREMSGGYFIGDQVGVGIPDVMDQYASCFEQTEEARRGLRFSYERQHAAHRSLAYCTMNAGLSVRLFWQVGEADRFQNLSLLGGAEVLEILRQDIAGRPPIVTDDQLLSALEQDVAETSAGS